MQFDFGRNWDAFSRTALTPERIDSARKSFLQLMDRIPMRDRTFLDIGFGQGLSLLLAAEAGAKVTGCDINPLCGEVLRRNQQFFTPSVSCMEIPTVIGSILEPAVIENLRQKAQRTEHRYDIVHSWGALHHTGEMHAAIANAVSLVSENGYLVLAIYNRHWTSPIWEVIKRVYVYSPMVIQHVLAGLLLPFISIAKFATTRKNPFSQERGMDFYYDVIDWVGGYPYEFAAINEIQAKMELLSFKCLKVIPAKVPTGCNEFVFKR
jgi:2-polyprenyl-3-methyl-5-hydroxy-6-metoxy-1,4-benzoquinol methylase